MVSERRDYVARDKMNLGWNMSLSRDGTKIAAGGPYIIITIIKGKFLPTNTPPKKINGYAIWR